jgi:hypothetical protein
MVICKMALRKSSGSSISSRGSHILENPAELVALKFKGLLVTDLLNLLCMFLVEFLQFIEQLVTQQLLAHQPDFTDAVKKYLDKAGSFSISEFNCLAGLFLC